MLLIYLILLLTQLSLFEFTDDVVSSDEVTRRCKHCKSELPLDLFVGRDNYCKPCSSEYHATLNRMKSTYKVPDNHNCPICGKGEADLRSDTMNPRGTGNVVKKTPWRLDHCHETVKFRSYLCHKCNLGVGFLEDNVDTLKSAIKYLDKHSGYTE